MTKLLLLSLALAGAAALAAASAEGVVVPFRQVEVSAPVSSHIVDMKVREGEAVKAGQPLAQLYGRLEELEMKRTKALLDRREYEAKGVKNLFESRVIPEARAMESRLELELARLNYETASEQFRLRTIVCPIDGTVVERRRDVGEAVNAATPIFKILDLSKVIVVCALRADRVARLEVGRKVPVRIPHMDGAPVFQGEILLVAPCADAAGLVRVKLLVEKPEPVLRAGLKVQVDLPD